MKILVLQIREKKNVKKGKWRKFVKLFYFSLFLIFHQIKHKTHLDLLYWATTKENMP